MLGIVLLFGNSCAFFLVLSFVLFLVLLCARNCATFRKFLCFFFSFKFCAFFCATLCSELCYFSEIIVFFLVPRLQFLSTSTSTKKAQLFFDCLSPKRKFEIKFSNLKNCFGNLAPAAFRAVPVSGAVSLLARKTG